MGSKIDIKELIKKHQKKLCALSGEPLADEPALTDKHRKTHRAQGGIYTEENTVVATPVAHMIEHGIYRTRDEWLDVLKTLMDDRAQMMKAKQKIEQQLLAYKRRTDNGNQETIDILEKMWQVPKTSLDAIDKKVTKHLKSGTDPLIKIMLGVKGIGPVTVAGCLVYLDFEKADSPSAFWKYVGLHAASHSRYTKGQSGGGNKTLRCILWNMACSQVKAGEAAAYNGIYYITKERLANSDKIVKSRNTKGLLVDVAWRDAKPCHRNGAALRAVMKHFLADLWMVGRELRGLPTRTLYAEQVLHHDGIIKPRDRGWVY